MTAAVKAAKNRCMVVLPKSREPERTLNDVQRRSVALFKSVQDARLPARSLCVSTPSYRTSRSSPAEM